MRQIIVVALATVVLGLASETPAGFAFLSARTAQRTRISSNIASMRLICRTRALSLRQSSFALSNLS
jgi:hypothetical protein